MQAKYSAHQTKGMNSRRETIVTSRLKSHNLGLN